MNPLIRIESFHDWLIVHIPNLVRAVLIPVIAFLLMRLALGVIRRIERLADDGDDTVISEREKRARTLGGVLSQGVRIVIWGLACVLVLGELGVDIVPILTGLGIAGLAVGFGAQTLVKDLIGGFFLLLENQIRIGDVISAGDVSGLVEEINLRTTVLRDNDGAVHIIPNGSITTVTNRTREWARAVLDLRIGYAEDVERCMELLRGVADEMSRDPAWAPRLRGPFEIPGIDSFGDSSLVLRIQVQTRPIEQWNVVRELRLRVKRTFDEHGVEIPPPGRKVTIARSRSVVHQDD